MVFPGILTTAILFISLLSGIVSLQSAKAETSRILKYAPPLISTPIIGLLTGVFCSGINVISYREITFDSQSVFLGGGLFLLLSLFYCIFQVIIFLISKWFSIKFIIPLLLSILPIAIWSSVSIFSSASKASPQYRFKQLLGGYPSREIYDIKYNKYTSGFYTSITLSCIAPPEEAKKYMNMNRSDKTVKYDEENKILTVTISYD